jgi:hypothetical protein
MGAGSPMSQWRASGRLLAGQQSMMIVAVRDGSKRKEKNNDAGRRMFCFV